MEISIKVLGLEHPQTLVSIDNLLPSSPGEELVVKQKL